LFANQYLTDRFFAATFLAGVRESKASEQLCNLDAALLAA
jgi:hypothetical protein